MLELSICIPVYNHDVSPLIRALLRQLSKFKHAVEIIVIEDGSDLQHQVSNEWLKSEDRVRYLAFPINIGRAAIRNKLARKARAEYILFLDDDSTIDHSHFIENYLNALKPNLILCGGRKYPNKQPEGHFSLHWTYGTTKESQPSEIKNQHPYQAFHSNNFVVPKSIIEKFPFDESLTQYGHEDTLFGVQMGVNKIRIKHIENAVMHGRLENNQEFLVKTNEAIENLALIYKRGDKNFNTHVKLIKTLDKFKALGLHGILKMKFRFFSGSLEHHLINSEKPSMNLLNLYKLGYLATLT